MFTVRNDDVRRERHDAGKVVGGAVGRILVGAEVDADDAGLLARREPRRHRLESRRC